MTSTGEVTLDILSILQREEGEGERKDCFSYTQINITTDKNWMDIHRWGSYHCGIFFFFFSLKTCFGRTGVWTQGFTIALLLELHLQSILHWLFWRWGGYFGAWAGSNLDLPDLSLPSS
jgi:hypothetical protein